MSEFPEEEITHWIDEIGEDDRAAEVIWDRFFGKMVGVAKNKMGDLPKADRDEEDIAMSAMGSFFEGAEAGQFELNSRDDLWRLLVTITVRKVSAERRRKMAAKRGEGQVPQGIEGRAQESSSVFEKVVDNNKMPELVEDVRRSCAELIVSLEDPALQKTAVMKMEGYSNAEISEALECSQEQTKYRLKKIRDKWTDEIRDDNSS